jgi:molybdate transport system ATP-binding protein
MILVNFEKTLPRFILRAAFLVERGKTLVLWGESGSGKTTVLECVAGLALPERGEIIINEKTVFSSFRGVCLPPKDRGLGFVFHNYALFPHMNAAENIMLALSAKPAVHSAARGLGISRRIAKRERREGAMRILERFHIAHLAGQSPPALSAGEQQRLALARALATQSDILLMDEPFTALDLRTREQMWNEFCAIREELNMTVILVTHQYEEALRLGDRVLTLRGGEVYE